MNMVVLGAHPDDPESGCGGLSLRAVAAGHRVVWAYLSSGIPGARIGDRAEDEVREEEARAACAVAGVEAHFFRYPCSDIPFDRSAWERVVELLGAVEADLVLTHWPVDTHPDHQATGALGTQAAVGNPGVALAYYEVCTGVQTLGFTPNRYADISDTAARKQESVRCHFSQNVDAWWPYHEVTERLRHAEAYGHGGGQGAGRAEAYYLAVSSPGVEGLFGLRQTLQPSGSRSVRTGRHA